MKPKIEQNEGLRYFTYTFDVSERGIILNKHASEGCSVLNVPAHHVSQQEDVVGGVADLLGIQNDLLELVCLGKADDDLYNVNV